MPTGDEGEGIADDDSRIRTVVKEMGGEESRENFLLFKALTATTTSGGVGWLLMAVILELGFACVFLVSLDYGCAGMYTTFLVLVLQLGILFISYSVIRNIYELLQRYIYRFNSRTFLSE